MIFAAMPDGLRGVAPQAAGTCGLSVWRPGIRRAPGKRPTRRAGAGYVRAPRMMRRLIFSIFLAIICNTKQVMK